MSWVKPGSGLFRGPGPGFSTACPHPGGRPGRGRRPGRKGAAGRLVPFGPRRAAGGRGPSGRQAAAADLSSQVRRSRSSAFAVTTSFRMTAVTATLRALPPWPGPAVHLHHVGTGHAGRHRRHVQDVPRTPPPAGHVAPAPEGAAVAGEGGDADQGGGLAVADRARPARPGDRGRGRDRADARHRGRMPQLSARPSEPLTSSSIRRPDAATAPSSSSSTLRTGPSASGSPTSPGTAFSSARRSTRASRSTSMSRSLSTVTSAGAVGAMSGNAARRAAGTRASTLSVFASSPPALGRSRDWRGSPRRP